MEDNRGGGKRLCFCREAETDDMTGLGLADDRLVVQSRTWGVARHTIEIRVVSVIYLEDQILLNV